MIYFRNVNSDYPYGSGLQVDLKVTLKDSLPGYSLNYNPNHNDNFDRVDPTFGRQGCGRAPCARAFSLQSA